ncbi:hypothetical protein D3C81_902900 [compost metagenome]
MGFDAIHAGAGGDYGGVEGAESVVDGALVLALDVEAGGGDIAVGVDVAAEGGQGTAELADGGCVMLSDPMSDIGQSTLERIIAKGNHSPF